MSDEATWIEDDVTGDKVYDYIYGSLYTPEQKNIIKYAKKFARLDNKLSKLGDEGYYRYSKLDSEIQQGLKWFAGEEAPYMKAPDSIFTAGLKLAGNAILNLNPLGVFYNAAVQYGKLGNAIENTLMEKVENDAPLNWDTFANAYNNGESLYNNELDALYRKKYGNTKAWLAKQYLAGYTWKEIFANYGGLEDKPQAYEALDLLNNMTSLPTPFGDPLDKPVVNSNINALIQGLSPADAEFLSAVYDFNVNNDEWENGILEDYRQAKLSYGRWIGRNLLGGRGTGDEPIVGPWSFGSPTMSKEESEKIQKEGLNLTQEERDLAFTQWSGGIDFAALILTDPLTYVTAGVGTGVKFMGIGVTETARVISLAGKGTQGIRKAFQISPKLRQTWDDYGALIERYHNADKAGNVEEVAKVVDEIKLNFPELGMDDAIKFNSEGKVFSAADAANFYSKIDNTRRILSGNVSGTDFFRDSIFVYRNRRLRADAARKIWYKIASQDVEVAGQAGEFVDELIKFGEDITFTQKVDTPQFQALLKERKAILKRVTTVLSRSPGDQAIKLGPDAYKTADTVRFLFRTIAPRNVAETATQIFLRMEIGDQVGVIRGLYRGIMESMGVPETKIQSILADSFSGLPGKSFGPTPNKVIAWTGENQSYLGAAIDKDTTDAIGALPWIDVKRFASDISVLTGGKMGAEKSRIFNFINGAINSTPINVITRGWVAGTLIPKLGIRSAIDEGFFFTITAPGYVLKQYVGALKASKIATAATSSTTSQGIVSAMTRKVLRKITRIKNIDPVNLLDPNIRATIRNNIITMARKNNWTQEHTLMALQAAIADEAIRRVGTFGMSAAQTDQLYQLLTNVPNFLDSASSSISRSLAAGGIVDNVSRIAALDNPTIARMVEENAIEFANVFEQVTPARFLNGSITVPMMIDLQRWFNQNMLGRVNLGEMFMKHNGIRTEADAINAINETIALLTPRGDVKQLNRIVNRRAELTTMVRNGASPEAAVRELLGTIFSDMYFAFHGSTKVVAKGGKFNDDLYNYFKSQPNLDEALKLGDDVYADLVKNNLREEVFYSNIVKMDNFKNDPENYVKLFEDQIWLAMDRTVNGFMRQKAILMWYFARREKNMVFEKEFQANVFNTMTQNAFDFNKVSQNPLAYTPDVQQAFRRAQSIAEKRFTEIGIEEAIQNTLKYVDNPHVRTFLASSIKNVNRFYRATEDFYRRVFRLRTITSRVIYRMRLMHTGLENAGIIHEDENGVQYYTIPIDDILYSAFSTFMNVIGRNDIKIQQPKFAEFTGKVIGLNPSFQDSAGIPYLSGPIASVATWGLKAIAGKAFPTSPFVEQIDNVLLGDIGDNIDLYKALTPAGVQRLHTIVRPEDNERAFNSAIMQAIAYNAAFEGMKHPGMKPNASAKDKQAYLDIVRIGAHNIQVANAFLGLIYASTTTLQESTGLEEHFREMGYTNIRSSFFDMYDAILKEYGDDVQDPWALTIALWVGKNPKKSIYTVSRDQKEIKPLIRKTEETRDWLIANKRFIDTYGEAAYLFAPQTEGKINPAIYNWMQATGLSDSMEVADYLQSINMAVIKNRYYAIGEEIEKRLETVFDYDQRKALINAGEQQRAALKIAYPMLEDSLGDGVFDVTWETGILLNLEEAIKDKSMPIPDSQRKLIKRHLDLFNTGYAQMNIPAGYGSVYLSVKRGAKDKTINTLTKTAGNNAFLKQLNNLVLFPLINHTVRETTSYTPIGR